MSKEELEPKGVFKKKSYSGAQTDTEELEKELKALEEERNRATENKEEVSEEDNKELSSEEQTYKKRYGDLRRHSQKVEQTLKSEIEALSKTVEDLKNEVKKGATAQDIPDSEEEFKEWAREHPNTAKILQRMARDIVREEQEELNKKLELFERDREETVREKIINKIRRKHPYFDDLSDEVDFHDWLSLQPQSWQDSIYEDLNAENAIRILDVFVAETGYGKTKTTKKSSNVDAAKAVGASSRGGEPARDQYLFKESDIERMTTAQFEKNYEQIEQAHRTGKILYDLSGAR